MVRIWRVQKLPIDPIPGRALVEWETVAQFPEWDERAAKALALVLKDQGILCLAFIDLVPGEGSAP